MRTIHLEPNQVPQHLKGGYTGRKFQAEVCESIHIPITAGLWDGGSRDVYRAIRLSDGATVPMPGQDTAPWDARRADRTVPLQPGFAIVMHSTYAGRDMGLRFYVRPEDAAPLLPAPAPELSPLDQMILDYTRSRKASYGGKDRYDMARDDWTFRRDAGPWPYTRADWDAGKARLASLGYLTKAGAITIAGRNLAKGV